MPKIDIPELPSRAAQQHAHVETVTVPALDIFEHPFPTIRFGSKHEFKAGETYELDPVTAASLRERIAAADKADRRLLQRNPDRAAEKVQNQGVLRPA